LTEQDPLAHCTECPRVTFASGAVLSVESTIDPNGMSQVIDQLEALRKSSNRRKRERHSDLKFRFEQLAAYGELEVPREMRKLGPELLEIKTADDRVPFYFLVASNRHVRAARLTHQFEKSTGRTAAGKTPRKHLNLANWIMKGDRDHG